MNYYLIDASIDKSSSNAKQNWTSANIARETLKQSYVFLWRRKKKRSDAMVILARTALCVEWWLERRRKWRHINIVTALATGRGWQAKRPPHCFFPIPLILFARLIANPAAPFFPSNKGPPFCPSTPVTQEIRTRDCNSGRTRPQSSILGLAVSLFARTRINYTQLMKFFSI